MSYANAESTLKTILTGVSGLSSSLVTQGDYQVLDKGVTAAAVVYPGAFSIAELDTVIAGASWDVKIDLFQRFTTQAATHTAFVALRDAVITRLTRYLPSRPNPFVSNPYGFLIERIESDGDPQDIQMENTPRTGPVFRAQTLRVTMSEQVILKE
jgi:hypothetical protein